MKFLKILLWIIGGLFLLYLILCMAGPKKMAATATTQINASPESVYEEVVDFEKHKAWSPWHQMDPKIVNTITGTPGTVGHQDEWTSDMMGNGSQELVEVRPNEYAKSSLIFKGYEDAPSWAVFEVKPNGEGTEFTWSMDGGENPFMMRGMGAIMKWTGIMDMEKIFADGVAKVKSIAESKPVTPKSTMAIEVIDMPTQWYVGKRFPKIAMTDITSKLYEDAYNEIAKAIGGMDKAAGMPMGVAHGYDGEAKTLDLEIALPVAAEMKVPAGLNCVQIPAGRAAKHVYYGPYEQVEATWNAFSSEVSKAGHKERWSAYEVYANDPATVKSPSEIETWLIQPIE